MLQELLERHGIIVLRVVRTVNQSHRSTARSLNDRLPSIRIGLQFHKVSPSEFVPSGRIVTEPFAQLRAGPCIFEPTCQGKRILPHSARPQPLNQQSGSVRLVCRIINTFDVDHESPFSANSTSTFPE